MKDLIIALLILIIGVGVLNHMIDKPAPVTEPSPPGISCQQLNDITRVVENTPNAPDEPCYIHH